MPRSSGMPSTELESLKVLIQIRTRGGYITMSFFKHVQLHKYDLTDRGVSQACYDEITTELADAKNALSEKQLWILADHMREEFKDYMRPLFA